MQMTTNRSIFGLMGIIVSNYILADSTLVIIPHWTNKTTKAYFIQAVDLATFCKALEISLAVASPFVYAICGLSPGTTSSLW